MVYAIPTIISELKLFIKVKIKKDRYNRLNKQIEMRSKKIICNIETDKKKDRTHAIFYK